MIEAMFTLAFVTQVVAIAVPYALAALGGALTERSGVIDLALEGKLLFGAFAAAAVAESTGSLATGVAAAALVGALVAGIQVACALWLEADQVIVGIAINILALAGTRFLMQAIYHEGANTPQGPAYGDAIATNPLVIGALVAAVVVPFALRRTRWGLRLRAAGDRPDALTTVGVSPRHVRLGAALIGGALAGAGGAQLSLPVGFFHADMSSGRGYFAVAMVMLSGWRPGLAVLSCLSVAIAEALGTLVQLFRPTIAGHHIPIELAPLLPYILTLVALLVFGGKSRKPPASLGKL